MRRCGFTLTELLVALVLGATVAAAALSVLVVSQRVYGRQVDLADASATTRAATAILISELRGLDASAASGSDLLRVTPGSLTYRALRSLYTTCMVPDLARLTIVLHADFLGVRPLDPEVDSLLLFADGDPMVSEDDRWIHADIREIIPGPICPDGRPGVTVRLAGVPRRNLERVGIGAPVRGAALWEMKGYRAANGQWWVGMRRYRKSTRRWPSIQPVLGPIAPGGLRFGYYDAGGVPTQVASRIASMVLELATPTGHGLAPHRAVAPERSLKLRVALRSSLPR